MFFEATSVLERHGDEGGIARLVNDLLIWAEGAFQGQPESAMKVH